MERTRNIQFGAYRRTSQGSPTTRGSAYELVARSRHPGQYGIDALQEDNNNENAIFHPHAAEARLLKVTESMHTCSNNNSDNGGGDDDDDDIPPKRIQWRALGGLGLCIMGIGTIFILGAAVLLDAFWKTSMRAVEGEFIHPQLWNVIVFSDWAPRTVTITAAVLRICIALQLGVFTAMVASLMIERAGVPLTSAPLISMLRAVSVSPYNLITWTTFTMAWRDRLIYSFAIAISVLLTMGFQFTSTVLLSDFAAVNITTPNKVADVLLPSGRIFSNDVEDLVGSKLWNSQPPTYFRFAETPRAPSDKQLSDSYEDTGRIIRALLPFEDEPSRSRLRRYRGPAAVLDSRVVCVRPNITGMGFSLDGYDFGGSVFEEFSASGTFSFGNHDNLTIKNAGKEDFWPFNCIVPSQGRRAESSWVTSICKLSGIMTGHNMYQNMPYISSGSTKSWSTPDTMFLIFKSSGSAYYWQRVMGEIGNMTVIDYGTHSAVFKANARNWTTSTDGIWSRVHLPRTNHSMSVSACFTAVGTDFLNISMFSDSNGPEPSLFWDKATAQFNVDVIRNRYLSSRDGARSMSSRGILTLEPWEIEATPNVVQPSGGVHLLPCMNQFASVDWQWSSGTLGYDSSCPMHYAHSTLFQDIFKTTGSLSEALQAVLMVARQMEYYEHGPQARRMVLSSASYVMAEEKAIPVQWLGFSIVISMIGVHFLLVFAVAAFFLTLTKVSWIGNAWMAISQVVSAETEDIIKRATRKDDSRIEKIIRQERNTAGSGLKYQVNISRNNVNNRHEITSC